MKSLFRSRLVPVAIASLLAVALALHIDVANAFAFGGDEGFELLKAWMLHEGFALYQPVWNDQPPLHSWIVSIVFRVFGPSAGMARAVSIAMATGLLLMLHDMVRKDSGRLSAAVSVLCLMAWPRFIPLSVSAMLEIPTMFMGVATLWFLHRHFDSGRASFVAWSGMVFGLGMGTKLTVALFGPAVAACLLATGGLQDMARNTGRSEGLRLRRHGRLVVWGSAAFAVNLMVAAVAWLQLPPGDGPGIGMLLESHFSPQVRRTLATSGEHAFGMGDVLEGWQFLFAAVPGACKVARSRRVFDWVPIMIFGTACVMHTLNRPYWDYYTIHFGIPVCWLVGHGGGMVFRRLVSPKPTDGSWDRMPWVAAGIAFCAMGAFVVLRIADVTMNLRDQPKVADVPWVNRLRTDAAGERWVFTDRPIVAFHARKLVPPEIALLPLKRYWSGQIEPARVFQIARDHGVSRYVLFKPELRDFAKREMGIVSRGPYDAEYNYFVIPSGVPARPRHGIGPVE